LEEAEMDIHAATIADSESNTYLYGRKAAWFAYTMTIALMIFDFVDRQIIVSMFPFMKVEWNLSDKELGLLVSVISITVALFSVPIAWVADRVSRVKSIVVMASVWSIACISCMFTQNYAQLLAARGVIGLGEAGYGAAGAAMVATHFPRKMRGGLLGGFIASTSVGSVLGVILGGYIASHWGWKAAFGIVGIPGLVLALLYLFVRDYKTIAVRTNANDVNASTRSEMVRSIVYSRTVRWVCIGAAAQLIAVSALWAWLPSFLNRAYNIAPDKAGAQAALVVLAGALGSVVLGALVDWAGTRRAGGRFSAVAALSFLSMTALMLAFGASHVGITLPASAQFALIMLGGFLAPCTVGPAAAIIIDVVHPGVRSTGASVLSLVQNLLGLAVGPFLAGVLSDLVGLQSALTLTPLACVLAVLSFLMARLAYQADTQPFESVVDSRAVPAAQRAFA
jgi:MFS family permease